MMRPMFGIEMDRAFSPSSRGRVFFLGLRCTPTQAGIDRPFGALL